MPSALPTHSAARRVLIVDADRRVRRDLAELIGLREGVEVVGAAADPGAAIEIAERLQPDVVVIDPRLPDADAGFAVISLLRERWPATRIVVMSHLGTLENPAIATGANVFVPKSGQLALLLDAIAEAPGDLPQ